MIQFIKFIAISLGIVFSGPDANVSDALVVETNETISSDSLKLEPHRIQEKSTHTCGFNHAIDMMKKIDPDYEAKMKFYDEVVLPAIQKEAKARRKSGLQKRAEVLSIPIVFHIIHKPGQSPGSGENLDDQTIIDQLETLNEDFSALNPGWSNIPDRWADIKGNPEIKFCLAEFDPQGNPSTGITRHEYQTVTDANIQSVIKPATFWPTQDYYNVWTLSIPGTTAAGGVAGYAYLPYPGTPGSNFDGTVLDYRFTGKGSRTLSHELGHGLGLKHTWGNSGGCGDDDGIADTPAQGANTNSITYIPCNGSSWPMGPSTCNSLEHMYINYMDYVPSACRTTFSQGQVDVMRSVLLGGGPVGTNLNWASRNQLVQNAPSVAPVCNVGTPTGGGDPNTGGGGPPITLDFDAGIQLITNPTGGEFCGAQAITPTVILTNDVGDVPLTKCTIRYKITGIPGSTPFMWTGNLAKGETEEVSLAPFNSPDFNFEFTAWTTNPNDEQDENGFNDEKVISLVTPTVYDPSIFEDFEDETTLPTSTRIKRVSPGSTIRRWELSDNSAYGVGTSSVFFRNFQDPNGDGAEDILEFPIVDFAEIENPRLAFDIAYYNINNYPENDSLRIRVSTDCGETFTTVFYEGGEQLATVSQQQPAEFFPTAVQWRNEVVDLFSYSGSDRMLIEIVNIGYGNNNLYLDNINLSDGCASNVQVVSSNLTCSDECDGFINLILNGFVQAPEITWSSSANGQTGESLDNLCPGDYSVTVYDAEFDCEFIQDIEITSPEELKLIVNGTDISIPGADNGSVNAQGFGGTGFITYEWDFLSNGMPETEPFIFGLKPGIYCVTATDQAGCSLSDCVQIFGFECVMEVSLEITQPTCGGTGVGSGIVTITNAVGTPTVIWSQGGPFGFISGETNDNLTPQGGSFVVITDTGIEDCQEEFYFEIFPPVIPNISPVVLDETGPGNSDGSIVLNIEEGASDYSFAWSSGTSTTEELLDLTAGFYTVTISDDNTDCELIETFEITNLNCTLAAGTTIKNVTCFDGSDGELEILASGGTTPYTINWPSGPNVVKQTNLKAGIYPITVVDNAGCRLIVDAIVSQPAPLTITLSTTDESNSGALDGSVTAAVVGGTSPYQYAWSNNVTGTNMITGLGGGIYLVTVTDSNNCSSVKGASVDGKVCPDITIIPEFENVSCFGVDDGSISVTVTGGVGDYTYLWTPGDFNTNSIDNLSAGEYNLLVTDEEGCPGNATVTITEPNEFTVILIPMNESASGMMDGSVESNITGGEGTLTYLWSGPASFAANTPNISFLNPGEYCITVTDNTDCLATSCVTIDGGADPCATNMMSAIIELVNPPSCAGENDAQVNANVTGGTAPYSYEWNASALDQGTIGELGPGDVGVIITDSNECTIEASFQVPETLPLQAEFVVVNETNNGAEDGSITLSSTTAADPYTCSWTGEALVSSDCDILELTPGEYCVIITDANGCVFEECYTVLPGSDPCIESDIIVVFAIDNETVIGANDGAIATSVTGNISEIVSYDWIDENGTVYTGNPLENLAPGDYSLIVTDLNGCTGEGSALVLPGIDPCVEFAIEELNVTPIACKGDATGAVSVSLLGGATPYTYEWNNSEVTMSIENQIAGTYSVTITDNNNCSVEGTATIIEPDVALNLSVTGINESALGANNGSASASLTGGGGSFTYIWTGPNGFTANTAIIENLEPGEYCVVATDGNMCSLEGCATVLAAGDPCEGVELIVSISVEDLSCDVPNVIATYTVEGGVGPYNVVWFNNETSESIAISEPGQVSITVTDANGCIGEADALISEIELHEVSLIPVNPSSSMTNDGSASVTVSPEDGIYLFAWMDNVGATIGSTSSIENLAEGDYIVEVTNEETGCVVSTPFTLTADEVDCSAFGVFLSGNDISCNGVADGTIFVETSSGLDPFTYNWEDTVENVAIREGLAAGNYTVTVTDGNGCTDIAEFEVGDVDPLELFIQETMVSAPGANDGSLSAIASGGMGDFTYNWSNAATTQTIENLSPDEYCVTVTDANECTIIDCKTLEESAFDCSEFEVELVFTNQISCFDDTDGALQVNIINAVEPISYEWSGGLGGLQQQEQFQIDLAAGIYTVTVTDDNGCEYISSLELTQPESVLEIELSTTLVSAPGLADGSATVMASGGNTGNEYTYIWSDGDSQTTSSIVGLAPGEYCVTVGSGSCSVVDCIEVFAANDPCSDFSVEFEVTDVSCFSECDGTVSIIVSGGTTPYSYDWNSGETSSGIDNACGGAGSVTITDANNCTDIIDFIIAEPQEIELFVSATNATDLTSNDGTANAAAFGGTPPYTYTWSNETSGSALINLSPDDYTVVVTDANDCSVTASIAVGVEGNDCSDFQGILEIENVSCFGAEDASITVIAEGGLGVYEYDWSNGNALGVTQGLVGAGDFTVTVTDENNCELLLSGTVTEPELLVINIVEINNTSGENMDDGDVTIEVVGGVDPYNIVWEDGFGDVLEVDGLSAGIYNVIVEDANGCEMNASITIEDGIINNGDCDDLTASFIISPVSCFGESDGNVEVEPSGGTSPYDITTSGNGLTGLASLNYVITIEDANGCIYEEMINIPEPNELSLLPRGFDGTCGALGIAEVVVLGGTPPFTVEWSNQETGPVNSNLETGVYTAIVTDSNGCSAITEVAIENSFTPLEFEVDTKNATCSDDSDGSINVKISNGVEPYTFMWNDGITTEDRTNIPAGDYTLNITDGDGCEYVLSRTISAPAPLSASYIIESGATSTLFDVTISTTGGTAPYSYDWDDGSNNFINLGLEVGTYVVIISDDNGCEQSIDVIVDGTTTAVDDLDIISLFNLSPNPTNGEIFLDLTLSQSSNINISVYNILGQSIYNNSYKGLNFQEKLDLSAEPSGTYFVRVHNENGQSTKKFIKVD